MIRQTEAQAEYGDHDTQLYIEPVYGLRGWHVRQGLLFGARGYCWLPGENQAHCARLVEDQCSGLERDCACGFYAYWQRQHPLDTHRHFFLTGDRDPRIIGVVKSWGKVHTGKRGYRAEKSEIVSLSADPSWLFRNPQTSTNNPAYLEAVDIYKAQYYHDPVKMVQEFPCKKPF